jgi:magnesium-transporting ATPase (P-type)
MIYAGTVVAAGTGRAVVTAGGAATELGRIGTLVATIQEERTPLERRLDALGRRLVWVALGVGGMVAGLEARIGSSWRSSAATIRCPGHDRRRTPVGLSLTLRDREDGDRRLLKDTQRRGT